jgi:sulfide:quinone oxidoreductase
MATASRRRTVGVMSENAVPTPFEVVVAGGGIAAAEALLALRALAGDRVHVTLVSPGEELVYRPQTVAEPFEGPRAARYPLSVICAELGVERVVDKLTSVEDTTHVVFTEGGMRLPYEALVVAIGARAEPAFVNGHTFLADRFPEQLRSLWHDAADGYARRIAFVAPPNAGWTLPLYEIALLTAGRAASYGQHPEMSLITTETMPLAAFPGAGSDAVARLLANAGIEVITATHVTEMDGRLLTLHPGSRSLEVDRLVALPEQKGPCLPGLPADHRGFIPVERDGRVRGHDAVFAVGDASDFPIKQGGIGSQQADVAAATIAAWAGADVRVDRFRPILRAKVLTSDRPLYLRAHLAAGEATNSMAAEHCLWWPADKVAGRYLAPYLSDRELRPTMTVVPPRLKVHTGPPPTAAVAAGGAGIELLDEDE